MSWEHRNRGVGKDAYSALKSGRIGPLGRAFSPQLSRLRTNGVDRINYIHGLDRNREDIVLTEDVTPEHLAELKTFAREMFELREDEPMKYPSAYSGIIELPREVLDLSEHQQRELATGICRTIDAAAKRNDGDRIATTWAIHLAGKNDNLHLHIMVNVDPRERQLLIPGADAMRTWRAAVADEINAATGLNWNAGTLEQCGIFRPAKKRLPTALYKAREEVHSATERGELSPLPRVRLARAANRVEDALDELSRREYAQAERRREVEAAKIADLASVRAEADAYLRAAIAAENAKQDLAAQVQDAERRTHARGLLLGEEQRERQRVENALAAAEAKVAALGATIGNSPQEQEELKNARLTVRYLDDQVQRLMREAEETAEEMAFLRGEAESAKAALQHAQRLQTTQPQADTRDSVPEFQQEAAEPFRCGTMTSRERAALTRVMSNEELQARYAATTAAIIAAPKSTAAEIDARLKLQNGEQALREALVWRGVQPPAKTHDRGENEL